MKDTIKLIIKLNLIVCIGLIGITTYDFIIKDYDYFNVILIVILVETIIISKRKLKELDKSTNAKPTNKKVKKTKKTK